MKKEMAAHSSSLAWRMDRGAWVGYSPFLSALFVLELSK